MCDPVTIGMTLVSAVYGLYTTKKAASQNENTVREQQKIKDAQTNASNSTAAQQRMNAARAERARMQAQAAETGTGGVNIGELLDNVNMQSGIDVATITKNNSNSIDANRAETQSALNQIEQPDYLGTALQTGASLWSAAGPDKRATMTKKVGIG